jgi:hypothetical protein
MYAPHAAFGVATSEDRRALGCYGTAALWVDEDKGRGLFFRAIHMSQVYIDTDFRGRVDTVHRKFELTARQAGRCSARTTSARRCARPTPTAKCDSAKFQILHVVRPNEQVDAGRARPSGQGDREPLHRARRKIPAPPNGYFTMPVPVSRNSTAPGQKYGNSPMFKVMGTASGLNQIAKTILRAGHKAVDPALAYFDDGDISTSW